MPDGNRQEDRDAYEARVIAAGIARYLRDNPFAQGPSGPSDPPGTSGGQGPSGLDGQAIGGYNDINNEESR